MHVGKDKLGKLTTLVHDLRDEGDIHNYYLARPFTIHFVSLTSAYLDHFAVLKSDIVSWFWDRRLIVKLKRTCIVLGLVKFGK